MWILILWSLLLFIVGLKWAHWSIQDFADRRPAQATVFLLGALIWFAASGGLAMVAAH